MKSLVELFLPEINGRKPSSLMSASQLGHLRVKIYNAQESVELLMSIYQCMCLSVCKVAIVHMMFPMCI